MASIQQSPIVGFSATRRVERVYQQAIDDAEAVAASAEANFNDQIDGMAVAFNDFVLRFGLFVLLAGVGIVAAVFHSANMIARPVRELADVVNQLG